MKKLAPIHPGEILLEEFLKPMGISLAVLAKEIDVEVQHIEEIVNGKRAFTAELDLRLSRFFGLSEGYWQRGQIDYETEVAKDKLANALKTIRPYTEINSAS